MSKIVSTHLEWKYLPENYIEKPILLSIQGGTLEINNGTALARIDHAVFLANETLRDELTRKIQSRLHAVQLMTHKEFELTKASRIDIQEDGKKHYYLEIEPIAMKMTMGSLDIIVKDKNGNIVSDSKRERLNKQEWYALLVDKYRSSDETLNHILSSYQASVSDPDNELVHLYEIRDSLANRFGSKKSAVSQLGISTQEWDEIGILANSQPLKQGRHRGKSVGSLRNAEASELVRARKSVVYLVEKYLEYLEGN